MRLELLKIDAMERTIQLKDIAALWLEKHKLNQQRFKLTRVYSHIKAIHRYKASKKAYAAEEALHAAARDILRLEAVWRAAVRAQRLNESKAAWVAALPRLILYLKTADSTNQQFYQPTTQPTNTTANQANIQ